MIYFLQATNGGPIKIGMSADPAARRRGITHLFPYGVEVLATIEGDGLGEVFLHNCFAPLALSKEWFSSHPAIWRLIIDIIDNGRPDFIPTEAPIDRHAFRQGVIAEFGSLQRAKQLLGYSDKTGTEVFSMSSATGHTTQAKILFLRAITSGALPSYIADLRPDLAGLFDKSKRRGKAA